MAQPIVQTATGAITAGTSTTVVLNGVNAGNTVFVFTATDAASSNINTPTDDAGNVYFSVASSNQGGQKPLTFYLRKNVAGGSMTITQTTSTSSNASIIVGEIAGLNAGNTTALSRSPNASAGTSSTGPNTVCGSSPGATQNSRNLFIGIASNIVSETYTAFTNYTAITASNATVSQVLCYRYAAAPGTIGGFTQFATQSSTGAYAADLVALITATTINNNYQFLKAPDGMSVSEKIR